jgi:hypothetical protein
LKSVLGSIDVGWLLHQERNVARPQKMLASVNLSFYPSGCLFSQSTGARQLQAISRVTSILQGSKLKLFRSPALCRVYEASAQNRGAVWSENARKRGMSYTRSRMLPSEGSAPLRMPSERSLADFTFRKLSNHKTHGMTGVLRVQEPLLGRKIQL